MPPPSAALLPATVLFVSVSGLLSREIPPPETVLVLPLTVLAVTASVLREAAIPPPVWLVLPAMLPPVTVNAP